MPQSFRYVAVVRADNKIEQTFVLDGKQTIDELFQHVNDHRVVKMTGLEIHRDESVQPTFLDRIGAFTLAPQPDERALRRAPGVAANQGI